MSVTKAMFYPENSGPFPVQYNPVNFKLDKPVSWKEHDEQGQESKLEFQKVQPATISMELIFDTTHEDKNVSKVWVEKVLEMTNASVPDGGDCTKMRPPIVDFTWGEFRFTGVVESVNAQYTMFSQQGSPLRAKVSLKMKEWTPKNNYAGSGSSSGLSTEKVRLVTVQAGQSLSQIAASNNTTMQSILDCNPQINDPFNIVVGAVLAIHF